MSFPLTRFSNRALVCAAHCNPMSFTLTPKNNNLHNSVQRAFSSNPSGENNPKPIKESICVKIPTFELSSSFKNLHAELIQVKRKEKIWAAVTTINSVASLYLAFKIADIYLIRLIYNETVANAICLTPLVLSLCGGGFKTLQMMQYSRNLKKLTKLSLLSSPSNFKDSLTQFCKFGPSIYPETNLMAARILAGPKPEIYVRKKELIIRGQVGDVKEPSDQWKKALTQINSFDEIALSPNVLQQNVTIELIKDIHGKWMKSFIPFSDNLSLEQSRLKFYETFRSHHSPQQMIPQILSEEQQLGGLHSLNNWLKDKKQIEVRINNQGHLVFHSDAGTVLLNAFQPRKIPFTAEHEASKPLSQKDKTILKVCATILILWATSWTYNHVKKL